MAEKGAKYPLCAAEALPVRCEAVILRSDRGLKSRREGKKI